MATAKGKAGLFAAAGAAAAGLVAMAARAAARRQGSSVAGWIAGTIVVPVLHGRTPGVDSFLRRIEVARASGPALPPARIRARFAFRDESTAGCRCFRLAPKDAAAPPLRILYIHGGSYVVDFISAHWAIAAGLVERTGAELAAPLYPLAPESDVDAGLACVEAVYDALAAEAGPVVIAGDSAGGGLALALAQRLRDRGGAQPAALILIFPWLDATLSDPGQPDIEKNDPILYIDQLREAGRMWAGPHDPAGPLSSPLSGDLTGLPASLVLAGTRDLLIPDARRFAERCPNAELHEYPAMFHGFICAPIPEARDAFDRIEAFVRRLSPSPLATK